MRGEKRTWLGLVVGVGNGSSLGFVVVLWSVGAVGLGRGREGRFSGSYVGKGHRRLSAMDIDRYGEGNNGFGLSWVGRIRWD